MRFLKHAFIQAAIIVIAALSTTASAETIRSASGFNDPMVTEGRPFVGGTFFDSLIDFWNITGVQVTLDKSVRIDTIAGVGAASGNNTASSIGETWLQVYSSPEAFAANNLVGDVASARLSLDFVEENYSASGNPQILGNNDYIELGVVDDLVLPPGDYIFAPRFNTFGPEWFWALSTIDASNDLLVNSVDSQVLNLDELSDTGTAAIDVFGTVVPVGDYNVDGTVDRLDYDVWVATFGSTTDLSADGNRDGVVNAADYPVWRDNLGVTSPPHSTASLAVPEPTAALLFLSSLAATSLRRQDFPK